MRWHTGIHIRWSDLDAYGHVNNISIAEYVQEARTVFLQQDEWRGTLTAAEFDSFIIVAHQEIEYLRQIHYRKEPVRAEVWVTRVAGASIDLGFELWDEARTECYAKATNVIALVPHGAEFPRRTTDAEKATGAHFHDDPVEFRRHSFRGAPRH